MLSDSFEGETLFRRYHINHSFSHSYYRLQHFVNLEHGKYIKWFGLKYKKFTEKPSENGLYPSYIL